VELLHCYIAMVVMVTHPWERYGCYRTAIVATGS